MAKSYGAAIIGAGWVSGEHIKAYQKNPHTHVVGAYSRRSESAKARLDEAGQDGRVYASLEEVLADKSVDIISICSPPDVHAEQVIAAARAGKHLVIEKPLAMNWADTLKMREAVQASGVSTVVSFVLRWNPMFETTKALLADDAIGRLFYLECDYWHWVGPHYGQFRWSRTKAAGGSSLLSAGCHAVDALRWFGGEVVEVFGYSAAAFAPTEYEFEPSTVAVLKFANGAVGKVSSLLECRTPYVFNVQLFGDKGSIRNNEVFSTSKYPGQTGYLKYPTILPDSGDVTHHPFVAEIDHFVETLRAGTRSHTDLDDAVKSMAVCFAIDQSAATGKPVGLPL